MSFWHVASTAEVAANLQCSEGAFAPVGRMSCVGLAARWSRRYSSSAPNFHILRPTREWYKLPDEGSSKRKSKVMLLAMQTTHNKS